MIPSTMIPGIRRRALEVYYYYYYYYYYFYWFGFATEYLVGLGQSLNTCLISVGQACYSCISTFAVSTILETFPSKLSEPPSLIPAIEFFGPHHATSALAWCSR